MIYLFSSKDLTALGFGKKDTWIKRLPLSVKDKRGFLRAVDHEINAGDQIYLDISGLSQDQLKKSIGLLKKGKTFWGIIDPKGSHADPALLFFEGASDYIGHTTVKKGLDKKRFALALSWARSGTTNKISGAVETDSIKRKTIKLPAGKFEGWKYIRLGVEGSFFFLFISLKGATNLRAMLGETAFIPVRNRLREVLNQELLEADALLWMETETNSLFLVPPKQASGMAAIEAALKMALNSRLIAIEKLGLSIPVDFTFAFHYGKTLFQAPGKTGTVISESVNYIFHLGLKKAEAGRLTISGDVPEEALPDGLKDLFIPAGAFEGIPISHSKRVVYK